MYALITKSSIRILHLWSKWMPPKSQREVQWKHLLLIHLHRKGPSRKGPRRKLLKMYMTEKPIRRNRKMLRKQKCLLFRNSRKEMYLKLEDLQEKQLSLPNDVRKRSSRQFLMPCRNPGPTTETIHRSRWM